MNGTPVKIREIEIKNNVFLAPMAGITDLPFRTICKEFGCGLVYTEMVSAKSILFENKNAYELMTTQDFEQPVAVQLFGSEPSDLAEAVERIEHLPFQIVDINMGCPATKIVKNGEGSALMKTPDKIFKILSAVVQKTKKPVTVKIRSGFDRSNRNAVEVAKLAEEAGVSAITVHGRTRDQLFSGHADWRMIADVKQAVNIPVIGNGDVDGVESFRDMVSTTGCDAVMIGRGALGKPWVFAEILGSLAQDHFSVSDRVALALRHGKMLMDYKGEYIGVREMRKHLAWYCKGLIGATRIRVAVNQAESFSEIEQILKGL